MALLVAFAVAAAGCGGSDETTPTEKVTASASTSVTPAPSASATPPPTPSAKPLSSFEHRPQVQALRSWADAAVRDVNARKHAFPTARQFQVDSGKVRSDVAFSWQQEFDKYFPGPLPFTPITVSGSGRRSVVTTCVLGAGFSLTTPGGKRAEKREVIPVVFTMAKQHGTWLLSGIALGTADCGGVRIQPVRW